ncbi:MAG: DUF6527 family protein [Acidithiobacillus sp.]|jgi:hypothetical protein
MIFYYQAVERIPDKLSNGIAYHNEEFGLAALLCACGCGHRVTLLVPDSHQITSDHGLVTIRPSIAVCDAACKSHYFISAGHVEWLPAFTQMQAAAVMRNQIARHVSRDLRRRSWIDRAWEGTVRALNRVMSLFRL